MTHDVGAPAPSDPDGAAPATLGLDHIVLHCRDVASTLDWYRHHFGLADVRVDEWHAGTAPFPSLRVDATTIIDFLAADPDGAGHLQHLCFVVNGARMTALRSNPELVIVDEGTRYGAQGMGDSVYVVDPDGLTVEARTYPG